MPSREPSGVVAPKQSRGHETRARLIEACLRLVEDRPFEQVSIADIAIGAQIATFVAGGETIDEKRFPKLAAYAERLFRRPSVEVTLAKEREAA